MTRRRTWTLSGIALLSVWLVVGVAIVLANRAQPTPDAVATFAASQDFASMSTEARLNAIDELADRMNRLDFEQRRDPALQREIRDLFEDMTEDERVRYVEAALPRGLEQFFDAINEMDRDERQAFVDEALANMRRDMDAASRAELEAQVDDPAFQTVINEGMRAYMRDASAEAKLDLEPLITEMQLRLRELRR